MHGHFTLNDSLVCDFSAWSDVCGWPVKTFIFTDPNREFFVKESIEFLACESQP